MSSADAKTGWRMLAVRATACLVATACTVGPNYHRPSVVAPPAYKELAGWKVAHPQDEALRGAWWKLFQDSQLNALEEQANISNQSLAAADAQIGVAEAAFCPNLTLNAAAGIASGAFGNWFSLPSTVWALGAAISETVFEGGLRKALMEEARAAYDATVASYRQSVLTAFQDVEDNLAALRILEDETRVQDEAVHAARQALTVVRNQYQAGTLSYLDVAVTQTIALANERTAVDIYGRRMLATVLLIKALGGGWNASVLGSPAVAGTP